MLASTLSRKPPPGLACPHMVLPPSQSALDPSLSLDYLRRVRVHPRRIRVYQRCCSINLVYQRRILFHQRRILVYRRQIRVYQRRIIRVYRRPLPPLGLGPMKTVTTPPPGLARLHPVSQAFSVALHTVSPAPTRSLLRAGSYSISSNNLVCQRRILVTESISIRSESIGAGSESFGAGST